MPYRLTNNDYVRILNYYNKPIPKTRQRIKQESEKILAEKLCKCIKKLDPEHEAKSIGICTKTIFNKRGLTRGKFKCKKNRTVKFRKT